MGLTYCMIEGTDHFLWQFIVHWGHETTDNGSSISKLTHPVIKHVLFKCFELRHTSVGFRITGPLWWIPIDHRGIPFKKVSNLELWYLCYVKLNKLLNDNVAMLLMSRYRFIRK